MSDTMPMPATTTSEQDRHTAGQRRTNILWETTQALIATSVVWTVLYVGSRVALAAVNDTVSDQASATAQAAFVFLTNIASLVIGFYFGRTNHQRVGGVELGR